MVIIMAAAGLFALFVFLAMLWNEHKQKEYIKTENLRLAKALEAERLRMKTVKYKNDEPENLF
jgi:hypothetical protein